MEHGTSEDFSVTRDGLTLRGVINRPEGSNDDHVVIVMHGFLRDMGNEPGTLYQDISDQLVAAGMTSVRFNFNGRGSSDGAFADSDVFNQIEDALSVINYVHDTLQPQDIALLGHSQGGVVAGMSAGMCNDIVRALVMLAPAATLKDDALRGLLLGTPFDAQHIPETITLRSGQHINGKYSRIAKILPIYETTAAFHGPALAIQGSDDQVIGANVVANYAAAMPNCETTRYDHLGHAFEGADREVALGQAIQFLTYEQ